MPENRPRSREKFVTGGSKGVQKRGQGLHTGPVGSGRPVSQSSGGSQRSVRAGKLPIGVILIGLLLLLASGGGLSLLGGSSGGQSADLPNLGSLSNFTGSTSAGSGWKLAANVGTLDTSVAPEAREKRTTILGSSQDEVTIMLYMCGTDLESRNGMATADLQEMLNANLGTRVNLLVYTGGCKSWRNQQVSSQVNQIYQVKNGKLTCLVSDTTQLDGKSAAPMTEPEILAGFIRWCAKEFPANRNALIFWDHGGGSLSGYGYDEKNPRSGSMSLTGIDRALEGGGMTFDFIGFDACLMATMENALMLSKYADYLIASEETEPGVGWYYTDWLTALGANTSMPTIEIGKRIVDDFVDVCARSCKGQKTTLSVVDLAELEATAPAQLTGFSRSAMELLQQKEYQTVSDARYQSREFAQSSKIDQVDLVHLAENLDTDKAHALTKCILSAVKYNRTSSNMTNAYGLSIYFPYQKASSVDAAVKTYEQIGMDSEYARCISQFASLEVSGQAASGGTTSPLPSLLGTLGSSTNGSAEAISALLNGFLSGGFGGISDLNSANTGFFSNKALSDAETADYIASHRFDADALRWTTNAAGERALQLSEEQWSLVRSLELNLFYDDGAGYIDLGLDNLFAFDENGALLGDTDRTWLAINGQPVAYYYLDTTEDGDHYTITGRVPAMCNGERVDLLLVFDDANPRGYIAGMRTDYAAGETETIAKSVEALTPGDTLEFLCDYYSYDGTYEDSYYLGEPMTVTENMTISNVDVGTGNIHVTYRFTDIYNQHYWTPAFTQ